MTVTRRQWRSYTDEPLPSGAEALGEPLSAFPSWFLRIECDRCGKVQMVNESHAVRWRDRKLHDILAGMRHDELRQDARRRRSCSPGVEVTLVSSRSVRKIVLLA